MCRYDILTCEDIDDFTDIKFVSYFVLKVAPWVIANIVFPERELEKET